jgi:hypothetical protein
MSWSAVFWSAFASVPLVFWTTLPIGATVIAIAAEVAYWRRTSSVMSTARGEVKASDLTPTELRDALRGRLLRQCLTAEGATRMVYILRIFLLPSAHWSLLVWTTWGLASVVALWLWRCGWSRDRIVLLWGSCLTVQVSWCPMIGGGALTVVCPECLRGLGRGGSQRGRHSFFCLGRWPGLPCDGGAARASKICVGNVWGATRRCGDSQALC